MSDIIKEVRVRPKGIYQDRDIKVIIEKSGLFNKKRKVYGIPWGKVEETWSTWEPIEFNVSDLTEDNDFGKYSRFYADYIIQRDNPVSYHKRNNLEFSSEWNSDLDIIKLFILINAEKYMDYFQEWILIEDPIVGEKGGAAPYYRSFGSDYYYLNNGVKVSIGWETNPGVIWSDDKGNELNEPNKKFYFDNKVILKSYIKKGNYHHNITISLPNDINEPDVKNNEIFYNNNFSDKIGDKVMIGFSKTNTIQSINRTTYGGSFEDIGILNELISNWKLNSLGGYDDLDIVKNIHGTPAISLSDAVDYVKIPYKSPFGVELGTTASATSSVTPSVISPTASNTKTIFKLTFDGLVDGLEINAKTDLPNFSIYVGDPKKDWPLVNSGELPNGGEEFDNIDGAYLMGDDLDEEYQESGFEGAEEADLEFNELVYDLPGTEDDNSDSYMDKGSPGTEQIGPIEPGLPANEAQKSAIAKAIIAAGCKGKDEKGGACARYSWNIVKNYHRLLKGMAGQTKQEAAGGNANQSAYYNRLSKELKYKLIKSSNSVTKSDLISTITSTKWGVGDVICYWSNNKNITNHSPSYRAYGHTQVYVGGSSTSGWSCDKKDNYGCRFVYSNADDNDWGFIAFRSPDVPAVS